MQYNIEEIRKHYSTNKFKYPLIKEIIKQEFYDGNLFFNNSNITFLGNLEKVGGSLWLNNTPITSFGNLKKVGGFLYLLETPIKNIELPPNINKIYCDIGAIKNLHKYKNNPNKEIYLSVK